MRKMRKIMKRFCPLVVALEFFPEQWPQKSMGKIRQNLPSLGYAICSPKAIPDKAILPDVARKHVLSMIIS